MKKGERASRIEEIRRDAVILGAAADLCSEREMDKVLRRCGDGAAERLAQLLRDGLVRRIEHVETTVLYTLGSDDE